MFVPEGHLPLLYVKAFCGYIGKERYPPIPLDDEGDDGNAFANVKNDPRAVFYSHLIFERFVMRHCEEIFTFQYPNILLRAPDELFSADKVYDGPCPQDVKEAEDGLEFVRTADVWFLTSDLRVDVNLKGDAKDMAQLLGFARFIEDARPLNGAMLCWRSDLKRSELLEALNEFRDEIYWAGKHPDFPPLEANEGSNTSAMPTKETRGRPNKKDRAAEIYFSIFPNGREADGKTWKEARTAVEKELGATIDEATLKRGVKEAVQKRQKS